MDPLGQVTTFEYDPFDRQVKIIARVVQRPSWSTMSSATCCV
ncbi:MAG: RHS repeat protein [Anaerolineae bacterium]|nr:MAG: RHS repeat protein [Anaerolineae bacterium]